MWLERAAEPAALLDPTTEAPSPVGVANIDYDAKGQRLRIDYKNGATHPLRLRPADLPADPPATHGAGAAFTDDCDNPHRRRPPSPRRTPAAGQGLRPAEPALHLRPRRQHHPHPGRRAADHLLPQPARRAEQRLHLRRPLPADPGQRPRAPGPAAGGDRNAADGARTPSTPSTRGSTTPATATPWARTSSATCTTPSATSCRCSTAAATRRIRAGRAPTTTPNPA